MSSDLRHQADWLAGEGYLAVAPDLHYWGRRITCMTAFIREIGAMNEVSAGDRTSPRVPSRPPADLDAARAWHVARPDCTGYGADDRWPGVRATFDRLGPTVEAAGVEHDLELHPGVGHGFLDDHHPAELPLWVKAVTALAGAGYDEAATRDARRRIAAFFDAHLTAGAGC